MFHNQLYFYFHGLKEAAGEKFYSPLNIERALDARDAISRALYSLLFGWLVTRINQSIHQPEDENSTSIAILDIFGFEVSMLML